jgi:hypothetical protein
MSKLKPLRPERTLTIPYNGKSYFVYYTVDDGLLSIRCGKEEKKARLSGLSPESLATLLLGEILKEHPDF